MRLLIFFMLFSNVVSAQFVNDFNGKNRELTLFNLPDTIAFRSDSTISSGQLIDKSGNGRHANITRNLITDSSAENGNTLVMWNGGTVSNSTDVAHTGSKSYKYTTTSAATINGMRYQFFRIIGGETVNFSIWIYRATAATLNLQVLNGNGSTAYQALSISPTLNTWVNYTGSFTGLTGNAGEIRAYVSSGSMTYYFDDLSVWITGKPNVGCYMANDSTLKKIDASNQLFTIAGVPKTFRTDIGSPAFFNQKIFVRGYLQYLFLTAVPNARSYAVLEKRYSNSDHFFNSCENVKTVKNTGGDFTTVAAAMASISDNAINNRYRIEVYDNQTASTGSDYTQTVSPYKCFIHFNKHYVYLDGIGNNRTITATLPDSVSDATADSFELAAVNATTGARNLTFIKNNGRYTFHIDGANSGTSVFFYKCTVNNTGVQGITNYRTANGLTQYNSASGAHAFGCALKNDEFFVVKNCSVSAISAFFIHSGQTSNNTAKLILLDNYFEAKNYYHPVANPTSAVLSSVLLTSNNSQFNHIAWLLNNRYNSYVQNDCVNLNSSTTTWQMRDWSVYTYKNFPTSYNVNFNSNTLSSGSLRITGSSGPVVITGGTAQSLIIPTPDYDNTAFTATGKLELGEWPGVATLKLGARLGDCSSVNKTLTMTINGVGKTVTFNQNFTSQSNSTILSFITSALSGSGVASLYQRANEYSPSKYN